MKLGIITVVLVVFSLLAQDALASSMRCGKKLVKTGDSNAKVLMSCGEPMQKEVVRVDESEIANRTDESIKIEGEKVKVEKWTYNLGSGSLLRVLTFKDGVLREIETGERTD